jgi:filamentous hemagglutinin
VDLGVKHSSGAIVAIQRIGERIIFLEEGGELSGLQHILKNHLTQFLTQGVPAQRIPDLIFHALRYGQYIGQVGTASVYEVQFLGVLQRVAIVVGSNGYVVTAFPQ